MHRNVYAGIRFVTALLLVVGLSGHALPSIGPYKVNILRGASSEEIPAIFVEVETGALGLTPEKLASGFGPALSGGSLQQDRVRPAHSLNATKFENMQNGLFGAGGVRKPPTVIEITVARGSWRGTVRLSDLGEVWQRTYLCATAMRITCPKRHTLNFLVS